MSESAWLSVPPKFHSPAPAATVSVDPEVALNFRWIPGEAETVNAASPGKPGQELVVLLFSSGTVRRITLGTNFGFASVIDISGVSGGLTSLRFVSDGIAWWPIGGSVASSGQNFVGGGGLITKQVNFTENATNTIHTGTVPLPAGAWLHNIQVLSSVLWTGGTATMKVGDTADDDGYFTGVNLKATDLLVGEVLDTSPSTSWGGKEGAYLVAATGQRGPVTTNFGKYYPAGSNITGIVTVGTPATTAGRSHMLVSYSLGENIAAVVSGP